MNCKPGDLAIVKPPKSDSYCSATGRFVETVEIAPFGDVHLPDGTTVIGRIPPRVVLAWIVKYASVVWEFDLGGTLCPRQYDVISDQRLCPIRDPGEDAQDEMLRPLPNEVPA